MKLSNLKNIIEIILFHFQIRESVGALLGYFEEKHRTVQQLYKTARIMSEIWPYK